MHPHPHPATDWAGTRLLAEPAPGIALWQNDAQAVALLTTLIGNPPQVERDVRRYVGRVDELYRYVGRVPGALQAIHDRYVEAAMAANDYSAFAAQRAVAWVIDDVLEAAEAGLAVAA